MKRYYLEMYSKNKFMGNADFSTMEECVSWLRDYIDKIIIRDTATYNEYVVKKNKMQG